MHPDRWEAAEERCLPARRPAGRHGVNHEDPRGRWTLLRDHVRRTCGHMTDLQEAERLQTLVDRYDELIADAGTGDEVHNLIEEYRGLAGLEGSEGFR